MDFNAISNTVIRNEIKVLNSVVQYFASCAYHSPDATFEVAEESDRVHLMVTVKTDIAKYVGQFVVLEDSTMAVSWHYHGRSVAFSDVIRFLDLLAQAIGSSDEDVVSNWPVIDAAFTCDERLIHQINVNRRIGNAVINQDYVLVDGQNPVEMACDQTFAVIKPHIDAAGGIDGIGFGIVTKPELVVMK